MKKLVWLALLFSISFSATAAEVFFNHTGEIGVVSSHFTEDDDYSFDPFFDLKLYASYGDIGFSFIGSQDGQADATVQVATVNLQLTDNLALLAGRPGISQGLVPLTASAFVQAPSQTISESTYAKRFRNALLPPHHGAVLRWQHGGWVSSASWYMQTVTVLRSGGDEVLISEDFAMTLLEPDELSLIAELIEEQDWLSQALQPIFDILNGVVPPTQESRRRAALNAVTEGADAYQASVSYQAQSWWLSADFATIGGNDIDSEIYTLAARKWIGESGFGFEYASLGDNQRLSTITFDHALSPSWNLFALGTALRGEPFEGDEVSAGVLWRGESLSVRLAWQSFAGANALLGRSEDDLTAAAIGVSWRW